MTTESSRIVYKAYRDSREYIEDLFEAYRTMYASAPLIEYEEEVEDEHSFEYCIARKHFVLIGPYTSAGKLLVQRAFAGNKLNWVLIGGSLRQDAMETFIAGATRHASAVIRDVELGEVEPVAFVRNTFCFGEAKHVHYGIAFAARIRNADPERLLRATPGSRGHLVPLFSAGTTWSLTHNAAVVELLQAYFRRLDFSALAEHEISENQRYVARYEFHGRFIKPLFRFFGGLFPYSLRDLDKKVNALTLEGNPARVLDVACGENDWILKIARVPSVNLAVGNDVSWSQIQLMESQFVSPQFRGTNALAIFTNHDARRFPFADGVFDVALCKNVLHHMDDVRSVRALLSEASRVSRRTVVVEIMDPSFESLWGRIRHHYYIDFLKDAGNHFLSRGEFEALTREFRVGDAFEVQTIRGVYMFAILGHRLETDIIPDEEPST